MDAHISEHVRTSSLEIEGEWWVLELRAGAKRGDELALAVLEHIAHLETRPPEPPEWDECPICSSYLRDLEAAETLIAALRVERDEAKGALERFYAQALEQPSPSTSDDGA